jgi:DNA invertase Pin-like site-specific DNA recombinase
VRIVGYGRVSTEEQAASGLGLEAQERDIRAECERRGWELVDLVLDEGYTGKHLDRPGLRAALELVATRQADGLLVSKLDRISRSTVDFALLLEWFKEEADATFVALDLGVDTSTPGGLLVANVFAAVAQWERDTISARTRAGLASLRARGKATGRPAVADTPDLMARIRAMRDAGDTLQEIADTLNAEGVPTVRGGAMWRPSSVQSAAGYKRRAPRRPRAALPSPTRKKR